MNDWCCAMDEDVPAVTRWGLALGLACMAGGAVAVALLVGTVDALVRRGRR